MTKLISCHKFMSLHLVVSVKNTNQNFYTFSRSITLPKISWIEYIPLFKTKFIFFSVALSISYETSFLKKNGSNLKRIIYFRSKKHILFNFENHTFSPLFFIS